MYFFDNEQLEASSINTYGIRITRCSLRIETNCGEGRRAFVDSS
jgi:hypothetical protein